MGIPQSKGSFDPAKDIPDLTGKVALVTGGHSGIGYETVKELAKHGAKVYVGTRTQSKATGAIWKLKSEGVFDSGKGDVVWLELDLSTPMSTRRAAEEFLKRETRLDILVNNAGIGLSDESFKLADGKVPMSQIMATNHLGHFVLTTSLLPLLKATAMEPGSDVRVVTVSSVAHQTSPIKVDWKKVDDWNFKPGGYIHNSSAYGTTKLANVLFSKELQRRFDAEKVNALSLAVHPGTVNTDGLHAITSYWLGWLIFQIVFTIVPLLTPAQGAYTSLFAATSPTVRAVKNLYAGSYLTPYGALSKPSKEAEDPVAAKDLWETSEKVAVEM